MVGSNDVAGRVYAFLKWVFGCSHPKTTFPITMPANAGAGQPETYVACLDCGRHLAYDWNAMRITGRWNAESHRERLGALSAQSTIPHRIAAHGGSR